MGKFPKTDQMYLSDMDQNNETLYSKLYSYQKIYSKFIAFIFILVGVLVVLDDIRVFLLYNQTRPLYISQKYPAGYFFPEYFILLILLGVAIYFATRYEDRIKVLFLIKIGFLLISIASYFLALLGFIIISLALWYAIIPLCILLFACSFYLLTYSGKNSVIQEITMFFDPVIKLIFLTLLSYLFISVSVLYVYFMSIVLPKMDLLLFSIIILLPPAFGTILIPSIYTRMKNRNILEVFSRTRIFFDPVIKLIFVITFIVLAGIYIGLMNRIMVPIVSRDDVLVLNIAIISPAAFVGIITFLIYKIYKRLKKS